MTTLLLVLVVVPLAVVLTLLLLYAVIRAAVRDGTVDAHRRLDRQVR